ncbi:uncharacterized protein [Coffea arabica]|uniref:Uncharacterized protein n=1 Tax=Coffea arabica TaxID=13443 RepID=A0A6P6W556_COFAR|nr:uncharacterized protein LOC113729591 [Coffea arabica]XP_027109667.1 uncharacterized protein LOC113729591 [Coffea arabica]
MASWSVENATGAYLRAVKMTKGAKEPDAAEFISALAAGNNAQLMVIASASAADSITLALVAAALQTGGQVICIVRGVHEQHSSEIALGDSAIHVKFVIGDALNLLCNDYREADCILIDCYLENCQRILETVQVISRNAIVIAYHACSMGSWRCPQGLKAHLLPIGEGLLVTKIAENVNKSNRSAVSGKKRRWLVKIDKYTGEEHVFRV